jgi:two-component system sensor histidine kinase ChvG
MLKSLSFRILLFNALLLFLPLGSLLYLDTYENQLLGSQENSMIQQGRLLSSALSGPEGGIAERAERILANLGGRVDSRLRVVDREGRLLADSAAPGPAGSPREAEKEEGSPAEKGEESPPAEKSPNASLLYRAAVYPVNMVKKFFLPPRPVFSAGEYYSGRKVLLGPEIRSALEGRYGAATRFSSGGQVSVNLYSAIPVFGGTAEEVIGAVLVSRSTYGILLNLYRVRLDIIKIFLLSLIFSLVLSLVLSFTLIRPIKKLRSQAEEVLDKRGRLSGRFVGLKGRDEIGDLSRSLSGLSDKLEKRMAYIDNFTADLLHELKNPLATIRGMVELSLGSPQKEEQFLRGIGEEENRMERFLARLRELGRVDNDPGGGEAEKIDLGAFIPVLLQRYRPPPEMVFHNKTAGPAVVEMNPDRLIQALSNPIDNGVSFSPPGGAVRITLGRKGAGFLIITIDDEGPGIGEENRARYFDRFYSERAEADREGHSGLGLPIVMAITEGCGGFCSLENRREGKDRNVLGCRFTLGLPPAD